MLIKDKKLCLGQDSAEANRCIVTLGEGDGDRDGKLVLRKFDLVS